MVVHMYRIVAKPSGNRPFHSIENAIEGWTSQYDRVLTDQQLSLTEDELNDGTTIFRGSWRFSMDKSEETITSDIRNRLSNEVEWSIVKYHRCSHDSDRRESCSWDKSWTYNSPPEEVT